MAQAALTDERTGVSTERLEYKAYLFGLYPLFLAAVLIGRVISVGRRSRAGLKRASVFREAADAAHSVIPYVFSGR